jgi:hypothetical protein
MPKHVARLKKVFVTYTFCTVLAALLHNFNRVDFITNFGQREGVLVKIEYYNIFGYEHFRSVFFKMS